MTHDAPPPVRTGDVVRHEPSGETWLVAWADVATGELAPCGWPASIARLGDCRLERRGTEAERRELMGLLDWRHRRRAAAIARREAGETVDPEGRAFGTTGPGPVPVADVALPPEPDPLELARAAGYARGVEDAARAFAAGGRAALERARARVRRTEGPRGG